MNQTQPPPTPEEVALGAELRELRMAARISQERAGALWGVARRTWAYMEKGYFLPPPAQQVRSAEMLRSWAMTVFVKKERKKR